MNYINFNFFLIFDDMRFETLIDHLRFDDEPCFDDRNISRFSVFR